MSSYIVQKDTIHRVVWMLAHPQGSVTDTDITTPLVDSARGEAVRAQDDYGDHLSAYYLDVMTTLGKRLYLMNAEAVAVRYSEPVNAAEAEDYAWEPLPADMQIQPNAYPPNLDALRRLHKSVAVLRYQCSEGNIRESDMYRVLDLATLRLAEYILSSETKFKSSDWA